MDNSKDDMVDNSSNQSSHNGAIPVNFDSNNVVAESYEKTVSTKSLADLHTVHTTIQDNAMNDYLLENGYHQHANGQGQGSPSSSAAEEEPFSFEDAEPPVALASSDDENNLDLLEEEQVLVWREENEPLAPRMPPFQVHGDFIDIDMLPDSGSDLELSEDDNSSVSEVAAGAAVEQLPVNIPAPVGDLNDLSAEPAAAPVENIAQEEGRNLGQEVAENAVNEANERQVEDNQEQAAAVEDTSGDVSSVSSMTLQLLDKLNFHQRLRLLHRVLEAGDEGALAAELAGDAELAAVWRCYSAEIAEQSQSQMKYSTEGASTSGLSATAATVASTLFTPEPERVMIWNQHEAYIREVKQVGPSACGPTAVINVLKALEIFVDSARVLAAIPVRRRAETASLPQYLLSRSRAGTTAEELVDGVARMTEGRVVGRFFPLGPPQGLQPGELACWLAGWMKQGAVPLATLNPQRQLRLPQQRDYPVADAWHHQMVHGVSSQALFMTNPLVSLSLADALAQLTSDSVLLVQKKDLLDRWQEDTGDLSALTFDCCSDTSCTCTSPDSECHSDPRWRRLNVLGQVVCALRESRHSNFAGFQPAWLHHVTIPAIYRAGISLFVRRDLKAELATQLLCAPPPPQLPWDPN